MKIKKPYSKPLIESYQIDREISLAMKSEDPGDGPPEDLMQAKSQDKQKNPFDSNPFGAGTKKK